MPCRRESRGFVQQKETRNRWFNLRRPSNVAVSYNSYISLDSHFKVTPYSYLVLFPMHSTTIPLKNNSHSLHVTNRIGILILSTEKVCQKTWRSSTVLILVSHDSILRRERSQLLKSSWLIASSYFFDRLPDLNMLSPFWQPPSP